MVVSFSVSKISPNNIGKNLTMKLPIISSSPNKLLTLGTLFGLNNSKPNIFFPLNNCKVESVNNKIKTIDKDTLK